MNGALVQALCAIKKVIEDFKHIALFCVFFSAKKVQDFLSYQNIDNLHTKGEHKIAVPPGSLILANVYLSTIEGSGSPVWRYKLLGVTHVEDRDQDGMEMQTV